MDLKLPPYGKQLIKSRLEGCHPWSVSVFFTSMWRKPIEGEPPLLMIPPAEYEEGVYDFSLLSGVAADVFADLGSDSHYLRLGIEIAHFAAPVFITFIHHGRFLEQHELDDLLWGARPVVSGRFVWPPGWSEELNEDYQHRANRLMVYWDKKENGELEIERKRSQR